MKRPGLAALLNAWPLPLGVGYLYLRRWGRFAASFVGLQIAGATAVLMLFGSDALNVFSVASWIAVVIDGYLVAKRMNKALSTAQGPESAAHRRPTAPSRSRDEGAGYCGHGT